MERYWDIIAHTHGFTGYGRAFKPFARRTTQESYIYICVRDSEHAPCTIDHRFIPEQIMSTNNLVFDYRRAQK